MPQGQRCRGPGLAWLWLAWLLLVRLQKGARVVRDPGRDHGIVEVYYPGQDHGLLALDFPGQDHGIWGTGLNVGLFPSFPCSEPWIGPVPQSLPLGWGQC